MVVEKFANAEKAANEIIVNKGYIKSYLGGSDGLDTEIAEGLFRDLETQYTTKLDYIANQEDLLNKQRSLIREKEDSIEEQGKVLAVTAQNIDTNKRSVIIDQGQEIYIKGFISIFRILLIILCAAVIIGSWKPELLGGNK